ncbi:MAG: flagellar biosynthesis protein FlhB [Arcobacteraceae bacterium]|nr:flagellar biosynthesis protein FlhB [Arcobacteraceae bacterium]
MADDQEKTEDATGKKKQDAINEGNVPKSMEVSGAAVLTFASIYILFFSSFMFEQIKMMMLYIFSFIGHDINPAIFITITHTVGTTLLYALSPIFALTVILAIAANVMQFGFIMTPLKIDFSKIDPINGIKNIFSLKKLLEALKLTAKLSIIIVVMIVIFALVWNDIIAMMDMGIGASMNLILQLTSYFIGAILLIIIIFAIIDFLFTRHYYFEQLKMSKQEIKEEYKQMEGDPQVKGRIRSIQIKMSRQRMMKDVQSADVVITNPTHYAVALKYDKEKQNAPQVVGKGIDFLALKIKDVAREYKVPIIENPALARALYDQVEIEREIPNEFYKAIAEIFTYIYELNKKGKR